MASTNKTPILDLSQFEDNDKPSWRGDYNADMRKIEAGQKGINDDNVAIRLAVTTLSEGTYRKSDVDAKLEAEEHRSNLAYVAPEDLEPYAKTAAVAPKVHTHTVDEVTDFDTETDARIDSKLAALPSVTSVTSGTYATRPTAASVAVNSVYVCTDIPEQYIKSGSAWVPFGSAGNTLGKASIAAEFLQTSANGEFQDIPGLSLTVKAGERPLVVSFDGDVTTTTAEHPVIVRITVDGVGVARGSIFMNSGKADNATAHMHLEQEIPAYAGGSTHVVRAQITTANGKSGSPVGKASVRADTDVLATLRVETA